MLAFHLFLATHIDVLIKCNIFTGVLKGNFEFFIKKIFQMAKKIKVSVP